MRFSIRVVRLIAAVSMAALPARAASLKVSPAQFTLHDVEPGKLYDLYAETGVRLTVFNDDDTAHAWAVSTHRPSERGRWETGYDEIPDAAWCWFEENAIEVAPQSQGYAHLFLRIPDEERYYNQHWIVTLAVEGARHGLGVSLAVDIRVQIETKARRELSVPPAGQIGMEPSSIAFEGLAPGAEVQDSVVIYNNDTAEHTYTIGSLFLDPKHEPKTYLKQSYGLLPDHAWIHHVKSLRLGAGDKQTLNLAVRVPNDDANFGKKWEDVILIQPESGRAAFVRVRIETGLPAAVGSTGEEAP